MHRNKLPVLFLVFIFAFLFILSFIVKANDCKYHHELSLGSQIGLGVAIILFFLFPARKRTDGND